MTENGSVTSDFPSVLFSDTRGGCRVIFTETAFLGIYCLPPICGVMMLNGNFLSHRPTLGAMWVQGSMGEGMGDFHTSDGTEQLGHVWAHLKLLNQVHWPCYRDIVIVGKNTMELVVWASWRPQWRFFSILFRKHNHNNHKNGSCLLYWCHKETTQLQHYCFLFFTIV